MVVSSCLAFPPLTSASDVGCPAQALEFTPQTLARPALSAYEHHRRPDLRHDGRAVVDVAGRGDGGPDTRLDRPRDFDDALAAGDGRLHPIARTNLGRRLRRRSVHDDVAALAQQCRSRAGLHEAHRAQPSIDTRLVGSAGIRHAYKDGTRREGIAAVTARSPAWRASFPLDRQCTAPSRRRGTFAPAIGPTLFVAEAARARTTGGPESAPVGPIGQNSPSTQRPAART